MVSRDLSAVFQHFGDKVINYQEGSVGNIVAAAETI